MRHVHSITQILIAAALLAACAPAAPAPTAVPPIATAAPTNTAAPTATLTPTLTPIPTEVPTPVPTQEDFSDLSYAKTFKEALDLPTSVTEEDILSGRLILHTKTLVEPFDKSITSQKVTIRELPGGSFDLNFSSAEGVEIVNIYVYNSIRGGGEKIAIAIQRIKTDEGDRYLQYGFTLASSGIGLTLFNQLNDQEIITPFYGKVSIQKKYEEYKKCLDQGAKLTIDVDRLWIRDLPKVQALMRQWEETGDFPEELSNYVLEPFPQDR